MLKIALDVRCDAEFHPMPDAIHLPGEVLGELGEAELSGLCHHEIQLSLRQVIELL